MAHTKPQSLPTTPSLISLLSFSIPVTLSTPSAPCPFWLVYAFVHPFHRSTETETPTSKLRFFKHTKAEFIEFFYSDLSYKGDTIKERSQTHTNIHSHTDTHSYIHVRTCMYTLRHSHT